MDGERAVVEEVGGAAYEAEIVDETEAGIAVGEIDGEHCSGCGAELAAGKIVIRVVGQPYVVDTPDGRKCAETFSEGLGIGRLYAVAGVEIFQSESLHVGRMRGHVCAEVQKHFRTHSFTETLAGAVVDHQTAY